MQNHYSIFLPAMFLVILTFIVLFYMFSKRLGMITTNRIKLRTLATRTGLRTTLGDADVNPTENLFNLFEFPVLYYFLTIVIFLTQLSDVAYLVLLSTYVVLRYAHSYIHCTYNNVRHRFYAYGSSIMVLLIICLRILFQLLKLQFGAL